MPSVALSSPTTKSVNSSSLEGEQIVLFSWFYLKSCCKPKAGRISSKSCPRLPLVFQPMPKNPLPSLSSPMKPTISVLRTFPQPQARAVLPSSVKSLMLRRADIHRKSSYLFGLPFAIGANRGHYRAVWMHASIDQIRRNESGNERNQVSETQNFLPMILATMVFVHNPASMR